jgi:hypothetical protein
MLNARSKYLEYISRIRNTAMSMFRQKQNQWTIVHNMWSLNKQNVNNEQYKISRDRPNNKAKGELKGKTAWRPRGLSGQSPLRSDGSLDSQAGWTAQAVAKGDSGGPSGSSPLRSDGCCDGQAGRLDCVSGGQGDSRYAKSWGGLLGSSPLRSDVARGSQVGRLDRMIGGQRHSNETLKMTLGRQGTN